MRMGHITTILKLPNLKFQLQHSLNNQIKHFSYSYIKLNKSIDVIRNTHKDLSEYVEDKRIIYNTLIDSNTIKLSRLEEKRLKNKIEMAKEESLLGKVASLPVFLSHKLNDNFNDNINKTDDKCEGTKVEKSNVTFPFNKIENFEKPKENKDVKHLKGPIIDWNPPEMSVKEDIKSRLERYNKGILEPQVHFDPRAMIDDNKGFDYLLQHFEREEGVKELLGEKSASYGNPNPNIPVSDVPCGGCGADLHCQESSLPGYMPSQRFIGLRKSQLKATLCQRCHYLRHHNIALNVRVDPHDYISSLDPITNDRALVLVLVDLLDMPASIWPGLINVLGTRRPIIVVGNKVDLIPPEGPGHLNLVMEALKTTVEETDLGQTNIVDTCLISAATGFGIEDMIDKIHLHWGNKGNMYLIGSTNAGKSTLFNALLGSDLCQSSAIDLIMRATTSPWPGTTLNMLKFPLLSPTGSRLYQRLMRLNKQRSVEKQIEPLPEKVNFTKDSNIATLSGYVGHSYVKPVLHSEVNDPFTVSASEIPSKIPLPNRGINPNDTKYINCKWCFDTPGSVSSEQILSLLTHEEIMKLTSRVMIIPRTYSLLNGQTVLIGGVARIDLLYSDQKYVCFTIYSSKELPVTVVETVDASSLYRDYLGQDLFVVPQGGTERLKQWPALQPKNVRVIGIGDEECASDITLSSTGWVSVTGDRRKEIDLRIWTPLGVGINVRKKSMLPRAINLKGKKPKNSRTPAYREHAVYVPEIKLRTLHWMLKHE